MEVSLKQIAYLHIMKILTNEEKLKQAHVSDHICQKIRQSSREHFLPSLLPYIQFSGSPLYCNILTAATSSPHSTRVLWIPQTISSSHCPRSYHCVSVCNLGVHSLFNYRPHLPEVQIDCLQAFCTISVPQANLSITQRTAKEYNLQPPLAPTMQTEIAEASLISRIQEEGERISGTEDTLEEMDASHLSA